MLWLLAILGLHLGGLIAPLVTEGLPPAPWQGTAMLPGPVGWILGIGTTVLVLIAKAKCEVTS